MSTSTWLCFEPFQVISTAFVHGYMRACVRSCQIVAICVSWYTLFVTSWTEVRHSMILNEFTNGMYYRCMIRCAIKQATHICIHQSINTSISCWLIDITKHMWQNIQSIYPTRWDDMINRQQIAYSMLFDITNSYQLWSINQLSYYSYTIQSASLKWQNVTCIKLKHSNVNLSTQFQRIRSNLIKCILTSYLMSIDLIYRQRSWVKL